MNAKPFGQPFTIRRAWGQPYSYDRDERKHVRLVKFPKAKLAVFLNSFGVAAGSAMMTARQSLWYQPMSTARNGCSFQAVNGYSQHVESNVYALQARQNPGAETADDGVCQYHTSVDTAMSRIRIRDALTQVKPAWTYKSSPLDAENDWSLEPIVAAAIICTAHPQSIDAMEAIEPIVFASTNQSVRIVFELHSKVRAHIRRSTRASSSIVETTGNVSRSRAG